MEIHEKAGASACEFQVGEELRPVDGEKLFDRFQFDDQISLNQKVDAIAALDTHALVVDRKDLLPFERKATQGQFVRKAFFVR